MWYHEPWETTLAAVTLIRTDAARSRRRNLAPTVKKVLRWLNEIPPKKSGEFVNPHYSGFLVWLQAEMMGHGLAKQLARTPEYRRFTKKARSAGKWLSRAAVSRRPRGNVLWSHYTFANAYIAYALSRAAAHGQYGTSYIEPSIRWFADAKGESGEFEDTEDTALAVLAVSAMAERTSFKVSLQLKDVIQISSRRVRCFVGYAARARSRALFLELKNFAEGTLSEVEIVDWNDFRLSQSLFSQLESACNDCRAAIFLVTKDDLLSTDSGSEFSPRDNVVFEAGLFAGRLGLDNTILIVEAGTATPSDWEGILQIRLDGGFEAIHTKLKTKLDQIARGETRNP